MSRTRSATFLLLPGKLWLLGEDLEGVEHMDDRGDESLHLSIVKSIKGKPVTLQGKPRLVALFTALVQEWKTKG